MTQLRGCKCMISNYFDDLLKGIGRRGSSFSDIDGVTHDGLTGRFLIQEFKRQGESLDKAQHWMLREISRLPDHFTVWIVVKRDDGDLGFARVTATKQPLAIEVISIDEYRARFLAWWNHVPDVRDQGAAPSLTADDLHW